MAKGLAAAAFMLLVLIATACSENTAPPTTTFADTRMCIRYKVVVGESVSSTQATAVQAAIDAVFEEVDAVYNQWNADSEVSRINQAEAGVSIPISDQLSTFLSVVDRGVALSRGLFDPTVEQLVAAWKRALEQGVRPEERVVELAQDGVGWHKLSRASGTLVKRVQQLQLNFDGVAKGYAVDRIVEELRALGLSNLYVEWGGEIRVAGKHPEGRPWRVMVTGIDGVAGAEHVEVVDLLDEAIATSGDYYQQWQVTGDGDEVLTYTHIVNPISGEALQVRPGGVASATVIAPTCALADLLATTCMLFKSSEEAHNWACEVEGQVESIRIWIVTRAGEGS